MDGSAESRRQLARQAGLKTMEPLLLESFDRYHSRKIAIGGIVDEATLQELLGPVPKAEEPVSNTRFMHEHLAHRRMR